PFASTSAPGPRSRSTPRELAWKKTAACPPFNWAGPPSMQPRCARWSRRSSALKVLSCALAANRSNCNVEAQHLPSLAAPIHDWCGLSGSLLAPATLGGPKPEPQALDLGLHT